MDGNVQVELKWERVSAPAGVPPLLRIICLAAEANRPVVARSLPPPRVTAGKLAAAAAAAAAGEAAAAAAAREDRGTAP